MPETISAISRIRELIEELDSDHPKERLSALDDLHGLVQSPGEQNGASILDELIAREIDPWKPGTELPFGLLAFLSPSLKNQLARIKVPLRHYRWSDRNNPDPGLWDSAEGGGSELFLFLRGIKDISLWNPRHIVLLPLAIRYFSFRHMGIPSVRKYLFRHFIPRGFYHASDGSSQAWVRHRLASYLEESWKPTGARLYLRHTLNHDHSDVAELYKEFAQLGVPLDECLPHLAYLAAGYPSSELRLFCAQSIMNDFSHILPCDDLTLMLANAADYSDIPASDQLLNSIHSSMPQGEIARAALLQLVNGAVRRLKYPKHLAVHQIDAISPFDTERSALVWLARAEALLACESGEGLCQMSREANRFPVNATSIVLKYLACLRSKEAVELICQNIECSEDQDMLHSCLEAVTETVPNSDTPHSTLLQPAASAVLNRWQKHSPLMDEPKSREVALRILLGASAPLSRRILEQLFSETATMDEMLSSITLVIRTSSAVLDQEWVDRILTTLTDGVRAKSARRGALRVALSSFTDANSSLCAWIPIQQVIEQLYDSASERAKPAVIAWAARASENPLSFFSKRLPEALNDDSPSAVQLAAIREIKNDGQLLRIDRVSGQVFHLAMTGKDHTVARESMKILGRYCLHSPNVRTAVLKIAFSFTHPACDDALSIIHRYPLLFSESGSRQNELTKAIREIKVPLAKREEYFADYLARRCLNIASAYSLLLRTGAITPLWQDLRPLLGQVLNVVRNTATKRYFFTRPKQILRQILSAYTSAIHASGSGHCQGENFVMPLRYILCEVAKEPDSHLVPVEELAIAYMGVYGIAPVPLPIATVFTQLLDRVAELRLEETEEPSNDAHAFVVKVKEKLKTESLAADTDIFLETLDSRTLNVDTCATGQNQEFQSCVSSLRQYTANPGPVSLRKLRACVESWYVSEDVKVSSYIWTSNGHVTPAFVSAAFELSRQITSVITLSQGRWVFMAARQYLHNLVRELQRTSMKATSLRRKLLSLPIGIHALTKDYTIKVHLSQFVSSWRQEIKRKFGVHIVVRQHDFEVGVFIDTDRLGAILDNCLTNAIASIEQRRHEESEAFGSVRTEPQIEVRLTDRFTEDARRWAVLDVVDNGVGFSSYPERGQSLGTTIIIQYMEDAKGTVEWRNRTPESGAVVSLFFPIAQRGGDNG